MDRLWGLLSEKKALGSLASGSKTAWELPGLSWRRLGLGSTPSTPKGLSRESAGKKEPLRREGMAET